MPKFFSYITLFAISTLLAQPPQVMGTIEPIQTSDGLHKIALPSLVRSYAAKSLYDFRILDTKGAQVPYFTYSDANETQVSDFVPFEMVSTNRFPDSSSIYIFKNTKEKLQKIILSIANYTGSKRLSVEGSDNQQQWYGMVNSQQLYDLSSPTKTSVYRVLNLPINSYRYIKLVFDDRYTLPVNVLKIGTAKNTIQRAALTSVPIQELVTTEMIKEKKTQLQIQFEHPQILDQIRFTISAPSFYNRKATLYTMASKTNNNKKESYKKRLAQFTLRSDGTHQFPVKVLFEKTLFIEIENQDNPKLQISEVAFFQKPIFLISDLKKGEKYTITAGDKSLKAPKYDLSYFKNRIGQQLPIATITDVAVEFPEETSNISNVSFWQQSWFMWSCIGLAGILIAYFATSLIKDLNKDRAP